MDDNDAKSTGGKYRMVPIFERAISLAVKTRGLRTGIGSGVDGTTFPHGTQANEFEQLVKKTVMTATQALQAGTIVNARMLGWDGQIGSVTKGRFADIVAVPGDPIADITQLHKMNFVMKGGKVVRQD
jgi:imidazolonepropionase-like amidohydrolase